MSLHSLYSKLAPKMGAFGKYTLPLTFSKYNTKDTVINTRKPGYCTVFDVSHMGIFETNKKKLIEKIFHINVHKNKSKLTGLINKEGHIIDDLIVGNVDNYKYRLLVNANTKHFYRRSFFDHYIFNEKKDKVILAIQGDYSQKLLEKMFSTHLDEVPFMGNKTIEKDSIEICRCGYTGEDGFELYLDAHLGRDVCKALIELSETDDKIMFGGLIERDMLRLEAGMCLSGTDFGGDMAIHFDALNMDFMVDSKYRNQDHFKSDYTRVGFTNKTPIKVGPLYNIDNEDIGFITSSNKSYNLDTFIGMGYLKKTSIMNGDHFLQEGRQTGHLKLTTLPFI